MLDDNLQIEENAVGPVLGDPAQQSSALVLIEGVTKSFGYKVALKNVTFSVPSGQICGLLGPNGAGKTTLFRLLMGILKATEGTLLIDGRDAFEERVEVKRLIGFLPDEPVFYSYLSGREVLQLSAAMHGLDVRTTMERIAPVTAKLRLAEDIDNYAEDYSRGMKKKLGLLLAMLHQPKLLVLDEPTNGLDVEATHLFYDLIFETAQQGAAVLIGVPLTVAAACLGKALEIGVILRFPPRSRGAMIGLMGWMGYASMMLFFVGLFVIPKIVAAMGNFLGVFTVLPWPWLRLFLGGQENGSFSFLSGVLACWFVAGITVAGAVWFSVWGAQQGLSGNFATADPRPSAPRKGEAAFGKDPLYRKEFLWFIRDRSAIVQTILIPLTVAGLQVFNLRGLLGRAQGAWNYLCGAGILFGTYFLWILGPKSLSSEGPALWIALTWPRGLESLLKAKAWLWSMISSGMVLLVLGYAAFLYPGSIWKIMLVGIGWYFFGRSMAEKAVTLVSVTSSSGEQEQIPWTRRGAAQLGMLTFCIGVLSQQWHIAIMGIVYSYLTAAAMWQNFRARLPYLYDPWSEKLPPPPTLMHAMIAISILVEGGAILSGIVLVAAGRENLAVARAIGYGICAVIVSIGVSRFLSDRGVSTRDVWHWEIPPPEESISWWRDNGTQKSKFLLLLLLGAAGGVVLGLFARGYIAALSHFPPTGEIIRKSQEQLAKIPNLKISYAVMAVGFAPFAEEYLFRGLLFRALDREWGGWQAVIGSAAFFAIYHSPFSWLPVALLGVTNALLFKKTGRLAPAVVLHMVYNAVVLI